MPDLAIYSLLFRGNKACCNFMPIDVNQMKKGLLRDSVNMATYKSAYFKLFAYILPSVGGGRGGDSRPLLRIYLTQPLFLT